MNKTINVNLANSLFHIDDSAYTKLNRYLETVKRSFSGTTGSEEIIADIEARIAELFLDKMENERQVITLKEVEEVINIMGQPEDYMIDEEIFEDEPKKQKYANPGTQKVKKLYRDMDQKFIGGVCSGLEHYLGIDALWIRIIFIFLTIFSGFGLVAYIILWVLVPEAATTAQKLDMTGKPVNISNIERKVKEGFGDVAETIKNVDYDKVGNKVKSGSKTFFDTLGDIIVFFFKILGKFIGILLIIIGATALIGLFIGLFTVGIIDVVHFPGVDFYEIINTTGVPVWVVSLLAFIAMGIPFFFVLYAGLKILVKNLKSLGSIAKFSLVGLWLITVGILIALGIKQAAAHAFTGTTTVNEEFLMANPTDTLLVSMTASENIDREHRFGFDQIEMVYDDNGDPLLFSNDVRLDIKKSKDSLLRLKIRKDADGSSFQEARERSSAIAYDFVFNQNQLALNNYFTTDIENKMRDQQIRATLYVPTGTMVVLDASLKGNLGRGTKNDQDYYRNDMVDHIWVMGMDGELKCKNCAEDNSLDRDGKIIIDKNGIDINIKDTDENGKIIINEDGIDIDVRDNGESFQLKVDENGVQMNANDS